MNVSSVKNLNGETFSAVQDATLTDVVQTNSGTWNEISAYQSASGTYLTAHQSLDDYATKAEVDTVSSLLSAGLDYVSANAGGNIPVSNSGDLYKVEFDGVDLYGVKSTSSTPNYAYSALNYGENYGIDISEDPSFNEFDFNDDLRTWSAFDIISISSDSEYILPTATGPFDITALDVYYKASNLYDNNFNSLADFSGYIGKITYDNLFISSYFDKPSYYDNIFGGKIELWFSSNLDFDYTIPSQYICSVGNKVQTGTNTISGIIVPTSALQEVSHDNTLSGNGTVDSPLGVVPGYNETVLWSGDASSNITLSESASNFEYLKVEFRTNDNIQFFDFIKPEISTSFTLMGKFFWVTQNMTYLKMSTFAMNDARTTINVLGGSELQFGSNYAREIGNKLSLLKIIGVNRKA